MATFLIQSLKFERYCIYQYFTYNCDTSYTTISAAQEQFSVPQVKYPLGGISKKDNHVYFLLQVFCVILSCHNSTI